MDDKSNHRPDEPRPLHGNESARSPLVLEEGNDCYYEAAIHVKARAGGEVHDEARSRLASEPPKRAIVDLYAQHHEKGRKDDLKVPHDDFFCLFTKRSSAVPFGCVFTEKEMEL